MIRSSLLLSIGTALLASSCEGPAGAGDLEGRPAPAIATNAIATNAIATNAIATNAIATNAIATNGLAGSFNADGSLGTIVRSEVAIALEDPDAQMFMQYLVSCALEPGQRLRWNSRFSDTTITWQGDLGLCPQWLSSAPSQACRERASACLLARNNVFGIAVPLSLRGDLGGGPIPLADSVGLWPKLWRSNTGVASVQQCAGNESGVERNCGWSSAGVGRCTPGEAVRVGAGACGLGNSQGNTMLRVCTRMHFCDSGGPGFITQNDDACGSSAPFAEFTCPEEGFYAVMAANSGGGGGRVRATVDAGPPLFRSSEAEVFTWREGAFYGNIFDAGALNPLKPQVRVNPMTGAVEEEVVPGSNMWTPGKTVSSAFVGAAHLKMWACSSDNWLLPDAYYERRVCAGVGGVNCAARYAGHCSLVCSSDDRPPSGDGDYGDCADLTSQRWQSPITSVLNHPCDLLPLALGQVLCRTVGSLPIALPTP